MFFVDQGFLYKLVLQMIPLLDSSLVGVLCILAAASFFLPNRMGIVYKIPIAILCVFWGLLYFYITFVPLGEADKAPIMRIILGSMGGCMIISNVVSYVIEKLRLRALKKAGLADKERRQHER